MGRTGATSELRLVLVLALSAAFAFASAGFAGCGNVADVHDTPEGKNNTCVTCHRAAFEASTKPKHVGLFPDTCGECHSTKAWVPTKVDIHEAPQVKSQPCVSCHRPDYDRTTRPKHEPRLPDTCKDCHSTKAWTPLLGDLHQTEAVKVAPCAGCHIEAYNAATNPPHQGVFPTQCAGCHGTTAWRPAVGASHDWFPLANKHATTGCQTCHKTGFQPGATPNTCVGCHQADFDRATNPPHTGFSTDCRRCHNDAGWKPFFHGWPLTGKHTTTACTGCHTGAPPVYAGTATTCVGCHRKDYDASPYPGHSAFSTSCADCHTTTAFKPALSGAHPEAKFPIARGAHAKFQCVDCHNPALGSSAKGANTDCIGCHTGQHRRSSMDAKHAGERGYPTGPAAPNFCLSCHPDGRN